MTEVRAKTRGFEPISEQNRVTQNGISDYILPIRKTIGSAGYDISTPISLLIPPKTKVKFATNVKAYMQEDEVLLLHLRSSIGMKKGLVLTNTTGIIDSDYYNNPENEGNIGVELLNTTVEYVRLEKGERIVQGIFMKYLVADNCNSDDIRVGGTGSTN